MNVFYSKAFLRGVKKLSAEDQSRVRETLTVFQTNPFSSRLRNHPLKGAHEGLRSISAGYDLRLLYREEKGHLVILFVEVGSHKDVYR